MSYEMFTAEHEALRQRVRAFVQTEIIPRVDEWEDKGVPREVIARGLKFFEAQGAGQDKLAAAVLIEEISRAGSGGLAAGIIAHAAVALPLIRELGSEQQQQKYLAPGVVGEKLGAVALAEPTAVYKLSAIETTARREGDEYIIVGAKPAVVNGDRADYIIVSARTGENETSLSLFIVEANAPGLKKSPSRLAAWRSAGCADLVFTEVKTPAASLLGQEGEGLAPLMKSIEWERIASALSAASAAMEIWRETVKHTKERKVGAVPMFKTQEISFIVAEAVATITAATELAHEALWKHARGQRCSTEALAAKIYAAKCLSETVERAFQVFGPAGLVEGHKLERFARDARMAMLTSGGLGIEKELMAEQMGL